MPRAILLVLAAAVFAGCAADGSFRAQAIPSGPCGTVGGFTFTGVMYADSKLVVVPVSEIKAGTEWRFYLRPITNPADPHNYKTVNVTIKGKFPADPPAAPNANDWISASGTYDGSGTGHYITQCVPAGLAIGDTFQYEVKVDTIGILDPRADVH